MPAFPWRSPYAPAPLRLEPLNRSSLARHICREASPDAFAQPKTVAAQRLAAALRDAVGAPPTPVPGPYGAIAAVGGELARADRDDLPDLGRWTGSLAQMEDRGRDERLAFLTDVFLGSHPALAGRGDVWRLPIHAPRFPSYAVAMHRWDEAAPTSSPPGPDLAGMVRLASLHYTAILLLLDLHFRSHLQFYRVQAVAQMMGPLRVLGSFLPRHGVATCFEALDVPDSAGLDAKHRTRFVLALLQEGQTLADRLGAMLPPDYPHTVNREAIDALREG